MENHLFNSNTLPHIPATSGCQSFLVFGPTEYPIEGSGETNSRVALVLSLGACCGMPLEGGPNQDEGAESDRGRASPRFLLRASIVLLV